MTDWPDQKIRSIALGSIGKHSMDPASWRYTRLGEAHPEVVSQVELQPGELAVVSFFLSDVSWYLMTTRRIVGSSAGQRVDVPALDVIEDRFANFKGRGEPGTEVMTLRLSGGGEVRLEYETFIAAMAPIYFLRFWKNKYPVLDKLVS